MAVRRTPTVGPDTGQDYANKVNIEIAALWNGVWNELGTIGGTGDAITAVCTSATLDAYTLGQGFYFYPTLTNSASNPVINIDARGNKTIKDQDRLTILPGKLVVGRLTRLVYDGTYLRIDASAGGPVRFFLSIAGTLTASENLSRFVITDIISFPAGFSGSLAKAGTASTSSAVIAILKNGAQIGTVTFNASATGTFANSPASPSVSVSFAVGDILQLVAPAVRDATLADVSITLAGSH